MSTSVCVRKTCSNAASFFRGKCVTDSKHYKLKLSKFKTEIGNADSCRLE